MKSSPRRSLETPRKKIHRYSNEVETLEGYLKKYPTGVTLENLMEELTSKREKIKMLRRNLKRQEVSLTLFMEEIKPVLIL